MSNLYSAAVHDVYHEAKLTFTPAIDAACQAVKKACAGMGTDEAALIRVLGSVSADDRQLIAARYKELFGQTLVDQVKSETGGQLGFLLQLISVPLPEAEAMILRKATKGSGTAENLIFPILMGRSNDEIAILKKVYFNKYNEDLSVLIVSEVDGDLKKTILAALQGQIVPYNPAFHTKAKAEEDAEKLYKAGEGKWGTDEENFIKVLVTSPPEHLMAVNEIYIKKHNHGIKTAIEKEFGGDSKRALLFQVRWLVEPQHLLAEHFESTMKGFGTDEDGLSAAVVRYQSFIKKFEGLYQSTYKTSLRDRIHGETSGDFRALLLALLDAPASPVKA